MYDTSVLPILKIYAAVPAVVKKREAQASFMIVIINNRQEVFSTLHSV